MHAGSSNFPDGEQPRRARLTSQIRRDAAHHVMRSRRHRDQVSPGIDATRLTEREDTGKPLDEPLPELPFPPLMLPPLIDRLAMPAAGSPCRRRSGTRRLYISWCSSRQPSGGMAGTRKRWPRKRA